MTEINEEYKIGDYVLFSRKINDVVPNTRSI
jgi:hypothetical protein